MKKCFFISYGGGHVNTIIPIIKELNKFDDIKVVSLGINLAAETLIENRIPCKTLSYYMTKEVLQIGVPLAEKFHNFDSSVSFADSIAYYGFSMRDLINEKGNEIANKVFKVYDRRLFLPINAMKEILRKERPDIVIATTMHRFEAAALIAANELGIPSLRVEDLLGNINKPFPDKIQVYTADERKEYIVKGFKKDNILLKSQIEDPDIQDWADEIYEKYYKLQPTKFAVLCNYTKQNIVNRGIKEESIIVTGQPAFDKLLRFISVNKAEMIKVLGLDPNKSIISFMSQPIDGREDVLKALILAMKKHKDKQLIIKLHPNEDGKIQKLVLKEMGYSAVLVKNIDAPNIINISDLVITVSSTTGLEAVVMDKPVISINLTDQPDFIPYKEMGIGLGVYRKEELYSAIKLIFEDSKIIKRLKDARQEFATDGKAALRVAELIIEMLNSER